MPPEIARCKFDHRGTGPQCCAPADHDGPHLFKCAGEDCPGLPWPASVMAHPITCAQQAPDAGDAPGEPIHPDDVEIGVKVTPGTGVDDLLRGYAVSGVLVVPFAFECGGRLVDWPDGARVRRVGSGRYVLERGGGG